jgi:hypothetical protein
MESKESGMAKISWKEAHLRTSTNWPEIIIKQ